MKIRTTGEDAYFAAANSATGFYSFYSQCFDASRIEHVYAVKGGPGTGKSRFLRDVAEYAERQEWKSEYIYCSSDPDSLDGVILTGREHCIALLDATAPHVYEPMYPGVREDIVNLGAFWDKERLESISSSVVDLNTQKSAAYRQAYRYLASVGNLMHTRDELVAPFIKQKAVRKFAMHLIGGIPDGNGYSLSPALIHSVGMQGEVGFDTYFAKAEKIYLLEDCRGCAQYLLAELGELAVKKKLAVRVSYDPILPEKIDGLFLCESGTAFVLDRTGTCAYPHKCIGTRRFVETARMKPIRRELNFCERMRRLMLDGAIERLEKAKEIHFQLESVYMSAMDFQAKELFTQNFCRSLFGLQNS